MEPVRKTRVCSTCQKKLPLEAFNINNAANDKRYPVCKPCRTSRSREQYRRTLIQNPDSIIWRRLIKYGITKERYLEMHKEQAGACAICFHPEASNYQPALNVDHDHITGKIRGLLCRNCNTALGMVQEDIETLETMIWYLKKYADG